MRIAITIAASILYILVSFMALAIASSSHIITRPAGKLSHIVFIISEPILYYIAFALTTKTKPTPRIILMVVLAVVFSIDCAWRTVTFSYMFIPVNLDIFPHFILIDFIPLYILLFITWKTGKNTDSLNT